MEPKTIPELIDALGGLKRFAQVVGKGYSTASEMKRAGSIHVNYWPAIIEAARIRGLHSVNSDLLLKLNAKPAQPTEPVG